MILEMMTPPPGIEGMGERTGNEWSKGFFATLQRSFEGGGGFMGGVKSSMVEGFGALFAEDGALAPVADAWGKALEAIGGIPVIGPFLQAFAPAMIQGVVAIGKKAWTALKGIFGGPPEEVVAARGSLEGFSGEVEQYVGRTESSTARLNDFIDSGWEQNRATVVTFFQDQAIAAGKSAQEGTDHWLAYQAAMEAGNAELMRDLEQQALDWNDVNADSATESEEAWAASHTAQTVTSNTMTDEAIANSARLKEAVVADTVEMLAGWTTMVDGMQEGWSAFGAEHATVSNTMRTGWSETVTDMQGRAIEGNNALGAAWAQTTMTMQWDALRAAQGVNAALATIRDRTVTITTIHRSVKVSGKRAAGGPVGAGNTYLVGERGPEYFTPTTPGYVTPNEGGGKANARMIGREVAKALQESPISIPQDAVTDSVLRAAPGREALRGWA